MDHFERIYESKAKEYHRMIEVEDVDHNLLPLLEAVVPLEGKKILDLGSGTGRIPLLLKEKNSSIVALDLHFPMLVEQISQREVLKGGWSLVNGDMRWLPFPERKFDVVIAGWAIGHLRSWFEADWQYQMGLIFEEMHRMIKSGGSLIVLETMTTGSKKPAPPTEELGEYYQWMEKYWGFERQVIQTDYQFTDIDQAVEYTEFFFGAELAALIRENGWARLPEWTGIWSKMSR